MKIATWLTLLAISSSALAQTPLNVFMAGDSTMAVKDVKDYPETGWGVPFSTFFDDKVTVINLAKNGRSTRTFINEGRWKSIDQALQKGDYVFIQFGHNDESEKKADRYTTPDQFVKNLNGFIADTHAHGANVILLTPMTRRYFEGDRINETHPIYSELTRQVAEKNHVALLDMDKITREYFSAQGEPLSKLRFMHIEPNLHPNYPIGVQDDTHLNQLGAREVAQLVLQELKRQQHPLAQRLRVPDPKHLEPKAPAKP